MRKSLFFLMAICGGFLSAQDRYYDPGFQVQVTNDVKFATNIDFLKNSDFASNPAQVQTDLTDLKTLVATGGTIPAKYYDPSDNSTVVKVSDLEMDIYEPANDTISERPLVIYLHTGNFLPPQVNGSLAGSKTDSSAVEICTRFAERGFVAASVNYRLGWNPLANDPVTGPIVRRATLLNAVYRAIHDTKEAVRFFRADDQGSDVYGIDTTEITLMGEGSGGYVALAYATLDEQEETEIQKFVYPGTTDSSYVQPGIVGDVDGYGGLFNLYTDQGYSADVDLVINLGGALADTSWLEAGDAPMISFHAVRDPFAPFGEGTVIVPVTNEDVVDVQGANVFMAKANALGNNDSYTQATYNDGFTAAATAKYGVTYSYFLATQPNITVGTNVDGLFPIVRPLQAQRLDNIGSPWQWWAPGQSIPSPRTGAQAKAFIDTIMGYAVPRMVVALELTIGLEEADLTNISVYPNPAKNIIRMDLDSEVDFNRAVLIDITGKPVAFKTLTEKKEDFDISQLPKGVYLLRLEAEEGSLVKRIIKE